MANEEMNRLKLRGQLIVSRAKRKEMMVKEKNIKERLKINAPKKRSNKHG